MTTEYRATAYQARKDLKEHEQLMRDIKDAIARTKNPAMHVKLNNNLATIERSAEKLRKRIRALEK